MKVVTFGEIMGRLTPPGFQRLSQALPGALDVSFAGAEANVAASICMLGGDAAFVSALPNNVLADACLASLRGRGIQTEHIVRADRGRLGLYFLETGANQRASQVIYDRDGSTISQTGPDQYDWPRILDGAEWFHTTGITPAISELAAQSTLSAVRQAHEAKLTVSCDLNFRKKLWRWKPSVEPRELAEQTMREVLPLVDVVIANEEDCGDVLGIRAGGTDVESGQLSIERYPDVARQLVQQFPNVKRVAITLRESISASHNNWGGMLYDAEHDEAYFAPLEGERYQPYAIQHIVDRVGAGDSFAAGLIFASTTPELRAPHDAIRFAVASSCLAHSIVGDFNFSTRAEVERLMGGSTSGRVIR
jgi:2-dehydro-3-deoxygluconokinase